MVVLRVAVFSFSLGFLGKNCFLIMVAIFNGICVHVIFYLHFVMVVAVVVAMVMAMVMAVVMAMVMAVVMVMVMAVVMAVVMVMVVAVVVIVVMTVTMTMIMIFTSKVIVSLSRVQNLDLNQIENKAKTRNKEHHTAHNFWRVKKSLRRFNKQPNCHNPNRCNR